MVRNRVIVMAILALGMVSALSVFTMAQEGGDVPGSASQQAMRARILQGQLMDALDAAGGEWETLLPKLDRVMVLRTRLRSGGGDGFPGASDANPGPAIPLAAASCDFRRTVDNKDSSLDDVKAKLQTLREEKAKIAAELAAARADLKAQVNPRQEAVLVLNGFLE